MHEHEMLHSILRRLRSIEERQHSDSRRIREILARLKQLADQDNEAISFELTAGTPTEKTK